MPHPAGGIAYSFGRHLDGLGIASIAREGILALHGTGRLDSVLAWGRRDEALSGVPVRGFPCPPLLSRSPWPRLADDLFDRWAAGKLGGARLLFGWSQSSLRQIRAMHRSGGRAWVERDSCEARELARRVGDAHRRAGLAWEPPPETAVARERAEIAEADRVCVSSRLILESYLAAGYPPEKFVQIPLGVDPARFAPVETPSDGPFRVVFCGSIGVRKGIPVLLDAWRRLDLADAELVLVGPVLPEARRLVETAVARGGVRCTGLLRAPETELRRAHLFVLPSEEDGFGLVVLEAMACGLPVIVSDQVGARECIREGVDGFAVPAGDTEALAERIRPFARDRGAARLFGVRARERALEFTWAAYRRRLADAVVADVE